MTKTLISNLFLLNMNGKRFIDDDVILLVVFALIAVHVICVTAYYSRSVVFRFIAGILYSPLLMLGFYLLSLSFVFVFLLLIFVVFFYFTILRERK